MNTLKKSANILPSRFIIREANSNDAQQISDVRIASWKDGYQGLIDQDYLDSLVSNSERVEKTRGLIEKDQSGFYVDPNYQRKGIGEKLFNGFFDKYGGKSLCLWTLPGSKGKSFYKKMGGMLYGERKRYRLKKI